MNPTTPPTSVEVREVGGADVEFTLRFPRPEGVAVLHSPLLGSLPFGHRQTLTVRDGAGVPILTELLSARHDSVFLPGWRPALPFQPHPTWRQAVTVATIGAFALFTIWLAGRRRTRQLAWVSSSGQQLDLDVV